MNKYSIISNESLLSLIKKSPISEDDKVKILKEIPAMSFDTRIKLLDLVKNIFLIEEEKKASIESVKKFG